MSVFLLQRLGQALVAIFGVMTLVFFIQRLTGDPTYLLVPETATQADIEAMRRSLGLDQPLVVQYVTYLWDMLRFDFGTSYVQNVPVTEIIASRLPYTLQLAAGALFVAFVVGLPVGLAMAVWRRHRFTKLLMGLVLGAQSMPTFWSGILMIMIFGVWLGWLPPSGSGSFAHLIMPSIALGLLSMATYARIARSAILDEMSKDYVRSARARGVAVDILDERGTPPSPEVLASTAKQLSEILFQARSGVVTVRALPPGDPAAVLIVHDSQDPDADPVAVEIADGTGAVSVF